MRNSRPIQPCPSGHTSPLTLQPDALGNHLEADDTVRVLLVLLQVLAVVVENEGEVIVQVDLQQSNRGNATSSSQEATRHEDPPLVQKGQSPEPPQRLQSASLIRNPPRTPGADEDKGPFLSRQSRPSSSCPGYPRCHLLPWRALWSSLPGQCLHCCSDHSTNPPPPFLLSTHHTVSQVHLLGDNHKDTLSSLGVQDQVLRHRPTWHCEIREQTSDQGLSLTLPVCFPIRRCFLRTEIMPQNK